MSFKKDIPVIALTWAFLNAAATAFCQNAPVLQLIDRIPFIVGTRDIEVAGDMIYVASNELIFTLKAQDDPQFINTLALPSTILDIAIQNQRLFATTENGLYVYSLTNPAKPTELGKYSQNTFWRVFPRKDKAFVQTQYSKLSVLDVSDPQSIHKITDIALFGESRLNDVQSLEDTLYIATSDSGLFIIDYSDLLAPKILKRLDSTKGFAKLIFKSNLLITLYHNIEFFEDPSWGMRKHESGFKIFDLIRPTAPVAISSFVCSPFNAIDIAVNGQILYLLNGTYFLGDAGHRENGLRAFDLSNPHGPVLLDSLENQPSLSVFSKEPVGFGISGGYAFITQYIGLSQVHVADPQNLTYAGEMINGEFARNIDADSLYIAVTDDEGGLHILERSNVAHPQEIAKFPEVTGWGDVKIQNNLLYVSHRDWGLRIYQLFNPPSEIGSLELPGLGYTIDVVDTLAFVGDGPEGFAIIDVSNPTRPEEIARLALPNRSVHNVQVKNHYAYVTYDRDLGSRPGFGVINVSDPYHPQPVFTKDLAVDNYVKGLFVADHKMYVQGDYSEIEVYDITNPAFPTMIAEIETGSSNNFDIYVEEQIMYLSGNLAIYDISDLQNPVKIIPGFKSAWTMALRKVGNYIYAAGGSGGIYTYFVDVATSVSENTDSKIVKDFRLFQNYPNPFLSAGRSPASSGENAGTTIRFEIPPSFANASTHLAIYNVHGELVRELVNRRLPAGNYVARWEGKDNAGHQVASGIYLYRLQTGNVTEMRKLSYLK